MSQKNENMQSVLLTNNLGNSAKLSTNYANFLSNTSTSINSALIDVYEGVYILVGESSQSSEIQVFEKCEYATIF